MSVKTRLFTGDCLDVLKTLPDSLMQYLIRLITPAGGHVLDPFTGSGSTGVGAVQGGFDFTGIEREPDYVAISDARISYALNEAGSQ